MYVCSCNALTRRAIADAARSGADGVAKIYAALDCAPLCGKCLPRVREILRDASTGSDKPARD